MSRILLTLDSAVHLTVAALVSLATHGVASTSLPAPLARQTGSARGVAEAVLPALVIRRAGQRLAAGEIYVILTSKVGLFLNIKVTSLVNYAN